MGVVRQQRDVYNVVAIDGEGITKPDGTHLYTLLLTYDSKYEKTRYIENWTEGLSTDRILNFLLHLRRARRTLCCAYYANYDVTMWLKDLSDAQKIALWRSGWVVYEGPESHTLYYIHYAPTKIFFVGEYTPDMGEQPSMFDWRGSNLLSTTVYDTSGFAQRAFVRALEEWHIDSGSIGAMKDQRKSFTVAQRQQIIDYCEDECVALTIWIQTQDEVFLSEGIDLHSWHGGGAIASYFLRAHHVDEYVRDPADSPELTDAIMRSYFGGRSEVFQIGHIPQPVYDYDLNSAYPSMARYVPDVVHGHWEHKDGSEYDANLQYAIWRVQYAHLPVPALPFRYQHGIYYPTSGEGWYHAHEIYAALRVMSRPAVFDIQEGWVFVPDNDTWPLGFITGYAKRRTLYKSAGDPRAIPYKYGLNSIYGKLAQHAVEQGRTPRYQCYYAAGFITAMTRAMLHHFIYADGHDMSDVVMLATDGVFCTEPRTRYLGPGLGQFEHSGTLTDMLLLQPGCWYTPEGESRTRGFYKESMTYERVLAQWEAHGIHGSVTFPETRFVGLGGCAGRGNFTDYGKWITDVRTLTFMPEHKYPSAQLLRGESYGRLLPMDMSGVGLSAPYVAPRVADPQPAVENLAWLLEQYDAWDQPDMPE